ncbi:Homeodomain-interacting protein kinase 3 [Tyrophagus putrescentiae]|nr:Homeodomain-interacting protein kinase 3 [Tyrophagus putrescentiae]
MEVSMDGAAGQKRPRPVSSLRSPSVSSSSSAAANIAKNLANNAANNNSSQQAEVEVKRRRRRHCEAQEEEAEEEESEADQLGEQLRDWVERTLNHLDLSQKDSTIDREVLDQLLAVGRRLRGHPQFWYVLLGSVMTQLTEDCEANFQAIANWLHYAIVELMNDDQNDDKDDDGQDDDDDQDHNHGGDHTSRGKISLLDIPDLRKFLHFLIDAQKTAKAGLDKPDEQDGCSRRLLVVEEDPLFKGKVIQVEWITGGGDQQGFSLKVTTTTTTSLDQRANAADDDDDDDDDDDVGDDQQVAMEGAHMPSTSSGAAATTKHSSIELVRPSDRLKWKEVAISDVQEAAAQDEISAAVRRYCRNLTLVISVVVALVESPQAMVRLLKEAEAEEAPVVDNEDDHAFPPHLVVNFLLGNISSAGEMAKMVKDNRLQPKPPLPDAGSLNSAILSVVTLFRAFSELKQVDLNDPNLDLNDLDLDLDLNDLNDLVLFENLRYNWNSLLEVFGIRFVNQLRQLTSSGGKIGQSESTAASSTFGVYFDSEKFAAEQGQGQGAEAEERAGPPSNLCSLDKRLLLLLQCLAEAALWQLDCQYLTVTVHQRKSAFKVPPPPPPPPFPPAPPTEAQFKEEEEGGGGRGGGEREGEVELAVEPVVIHPALSVGCFAYGMDDVKYQPYQWRWPFPLTPAATTSTTTTTSTPTAATTATPKRAYYTEVFLFTGGSMNIGFYFDGSCGDDGASSSVSPPPPPPPAAVFYSPSTGELLVNGYELPTNIKRQQKKKTKEDSSRDHLPTKEKQHSIVLGVLLETGVSRSTARSAAVQSGSTRHSPAATFYLESHQAAVTFFVNQVKVEVKTSTGPSSEIKLGRRFQTPYGKDKWERFLAKFSGDLTQCLRKSPSSPSSSSSGETESSAAVFIVALGGYQAAVVGQAVNAAEKWTEFPASTFHKDCEIRELASLYGFKGGAQQLNQSCFERKFRSPDASYQIVGGLGSGSFGTVFRCIRKPVITGERAAVEQQVAVKVMELEDRQTLRSIEREVVFLREIERVETGLFIKLLDSFSFSPMYRCLVFERMFCSLDDLISRNPPSLPQIGVIFYQLLQALKVLKEKVPGGFIHGDIKPPNVMVCAPPHPDEPYVRIKLIDFGLAHCIRVGDGGRHLEHIVHFNDARVDLNQTDRREMTPGYASPEWLLGHADLTLSDLWAVAVTVLELLIGGPLYRCTHEDDLVAYYQLAPIWRLFGDQKLGDFYQRLPDDPFRRFFTQEAPSPLSPRARPGWRLKTLEEVSAEWRVGAITATPRPRLTWEVKKFTLKEIKGKRPSDEDEQYPDLLGKTF